MPQPHLTNITANASSVTNPLGSQTIEGMSIPTYLIEEVGESKALEIMKEYYALVGAPGSKENELSALWQKQDLGTVFSKLAFLEQYGLFPSGFVFPYIQPYRPVIHLKLLWEYFLKEPIPYTYLATLSPSKYLAIQSPSKSLQPITSVQVPAPEKSVSQHSKEVLSSILLSLTECATFELTDFIFKHIQEKYRPALFEVCIACMQNIAADKQANQFAPLFAAMLGSYVIKNASFQSLPSPKQWAWILEYMLGHIQLGDKINITSVEDPTLDDFDRLAHQGKKLLQDHKKTVKTLWAKASSRHSFQLLRILDNTLPLDQDALLAFIKERIVQKQDPYQLLCLPSLKSVPAEKLIPLLHASITANAHHCFTYLVTQKKLPLSIPNNKGETVRDIAKKQGNSYFTTLLDKQLQTTHAVHAKGYLELLNESKEFLQTLLSDQRKLEKFTAHVTEENVTIQGITSHETLWLFYSVAKQLKADFLLLEDGIEMLAAAFPPFVTTVFHTLPHIEKERFPSSVAAQHVFIHLHKIPGSILEEDASYIYFSYPAGKISSEGLQQLMRANLKLDFEKSPTRYAGYLTLKLAYTKHVLPYIHASIPSFISSLQSIFRLVSNSNTESNDLSSKKKKKPKQKEAFNINTLTSLSTEEQVDKLTEMMFTHHKNGQFKELSSFIASCNKDMPASLKTALTRIEKGTQHNLLSMVLSCYAKRFREPLFSLLVRDLLALSESRHVFMMNTGNDTSNPFLYNAFAYAPTLEIAQLLASKCSEDELVTALTTSASTLLSTCVAIDDTTTMAPLSQLLLKLPLRTAFRIVNSFPYNPQDIESRQSYETLLKDIYLSHEDALLKSIYYPQKDAARQANLLDLLLVQDIATIKEILTSFRTFFARPTEQKELLEAVFEKNDITLLTHVVECLELSNTHIFKALTDTIACFKYDPNLLMSYAKHFTPEQRTSLLFTMIHYGRGNSIHQLLRYPPSELPLQLPKEYSKTFIAQNVLHAAASSSALEEPHVPEVMMILMQRILSDGIALDAPDNRGDTPLYAALFHKNWEVAESILKVGGPSLLDALNSSENTTARAFIALEKERITWLEQQEMQPFYLPNHDAQAHANEVKRLLTSRYQEPHIQVVYDEDEIVITGIDSLNTATTLRNYLTINRIAFKEENGQLRYRWRTPQIALIHLLSQLRSGLGHFMQPKEGMELKEDAYANYANTVEAIAKGLLTLEKAIINYDKHHFYVSCPLKKDVFEGAFIELLKNTFSSLQLTAFVTTESEYVRREYITLKLPVLKKWHTYLPESFTNIHQAFIAFEAEADKLPTVVRPASASSGTTGKTSKTIKKDNNNTASPGPDSVVRFQVREEEKDDKSKKTTEWQIKIAELQNNIKALELNKTIAEQELESIRTQHQKQLAKLAKRGKDKARKKHIKPAAPQKTPEMQKEERDAEAELNAVISDIAEINTKIADIKKAHSTATAQEPLQSNTSSETKQAAEIKPEASANTLATSTPDTTQVGPETLYAEPDYVLKKENANNNNSNTINNNARDPLAELRQAASNLTHHTDLRDLLLKEAKDALAFFHEVAKHTKGVENPLVLEGILLRATTCLHQSYQYGPPEQHPLLSRLPEDMLRIFRNAIIRHTPTLPNDAIAGMISLLSKACDAKDPSHVMLPRVQKREVNAFHNSSLNEETFNELRGYVAQIQKLIAGEGYTHIHEKGWKAGAYMLFALCTKAAACWKTLETQSPALRFLDKNHSLTPLSRTIASFRNKLLHPTHDKNNPNAIIGSLAAPTIYHVALEHFSKLVLKESWHVYKMKLDETPPPHAITPQQSQPIFDRLHTLLFKIANATDNRQQEQLSAKFCLHLRQLFPQEITSFSSSYLNNTSLATRLTGIHKQLNYDIIDDVALCKEVTAFAADYRNQVPLAPTKQAALGQGHK